MKKPDLEASEVESFFSRAQNWVRLYSDLGKQVRGLGGHAVTPYMHILVYHVPRILEVYGSLKTFSCQGNIMEFVTKKSINNSFILYSIYTVEQYILLNL